MIFTRTACGDDNNNNNNTNLLPYYRLINSSVLLNYLIKHMVNASSFTAEIWMQLGDILGGLLRSQQLEE